MARSYKRDSRGRFAGGGGGSGGKRGGTSKGSSSGGRKRNKSFTTTTGTFLTRQRNKLAQQKRTKAFSSKATVGRSAKEAYKAASGAKRKAAKERPRASKPNVSMAAMERRAKKVTDAAILERRMRADSWRDEIAFRSGQYPRSPKKRADYSARSTQAEMNRRQNSLITAQRARDFYKSASFAASNFSLRPRYSTTSAPRNRPLPALTSYFSAWRGYSYKPSKPRKRS